MSSGRSVPLNLQHGLSFWIIKQGPECHGAAGKSIKLRRLKEIGQRDRKLHLYCGFCLFFVSLLFSFFLQQIFQISLTYLHLQINVLFCVIYIFSTVSKLQLRKGLYNPGLNSQKPKWWIWRKSPKFMATVFFPSIKKSTILSTTEALEWWELLYTLIVITPPNPDHRSALFKQSSFNISKSPVLLRTTFSQYLPWKISKETIYHRYSNSGIDTNVSISWIAFIYNHTSLHSIGIMEMFL